ncbi:MAG: hypothetical protein J6D28_02140 [Bacilli bacterium]|nr:hypothetical protein [Bacilli bacterium]
MEKLDIKVTLNKESMLFNNYNSDQLSDELSNYIYSQCKGIPVNKKININIYHSHSLSTNEKECIVDAIRSNYGIDIKENTLKLKNELVKELILIIIGSLFLIVSNILAFLNIDIIEEIVSIFGWVVIWEVAYNIIFMDTKLRYENKRLKKIVKSKINFIKEKTI